MKSTYKLFGTVWDGIEESEQIIDINCNEKDIPAIVSLSSLLSTNSMDDIAQLLEPFSGFKAIALAIDYHPKNENPVLKAFIKKRERQIIKYLLSKFNTVSYCYNKDNQIPSGATNA